MSTSEITAGVRYWSALYTRIGQRVSSYALVAEGVLLNPLLPLGDDRSVLEGVDVRAIVLTNRHHLRDSVLLAADGAAIHAPTGGLADLVDVVPPVRGYADGDDLPGGLLAVAVGALSPDEFAVHSAAHRVLAVADGVCRDGDGPLRPMPDRLLGDDPVGVKRGLAAAYSRICDELDFDHLLLAHGPPVVGDGREQLRRYAGELAATAAAAGG